MVLNEALNTAQRKCDFEITVDFNEVYTSRMQESREKKVKYSKQEHELGYYSTSRQPELALVRNSGGIPRSRAMTIMLKVTARI